MAWKTVDVKTGAHDGIASPDTGDSVQVEVRAFIRETFLQFRPTLEFGDTDDLVDMGVLDSLAFIELVEAIERRFGVRVHDEEITPENFGSVEAMANLVRRRRVA